MNDDGYVHDPASGDGADSNDRTSSATDNTDERSSRPRNTANPSDADFDWRGWLLVAAVVFAFLVVPGALYLLPTARDAVAGLGLGFRHTYLVLPLLPAFLLGTIAVWSAVRSRSR